MLERQPIDAAYHNIIFDKPSKNSHLSGIFIVTKYLRQLTSKEIMPEIHDRARLLNF